MALYTYLCFGCCYFSVSMSHSPTSLPPYFTSLPPSIFSVVMVQTMNGANNAVGDSVFLSAWSCAFCTSEVLDVKYFFEPKFLSCVHVDFIVFLWIMSFETNKCSFQKKIFYCVPNEYLSALVQGAAGLCFVLH